jgi:hypothetical protein
MSGRNKSIFAVFLTLAAFSAYLFLAFPLSRFAAKIARADQVVASTTKGTASITIIGENARRLIEAVSSAKRKRYPPGVTDACIYDVKITFLRGTNVLGDILSCKDIFIVSGRKYRDGSGVIGELAVTPIRTAYAEQHRRQREETE